MPLPKKIPLEEYAKTKGDALLRKVCSKTGVWKRDGWKAIYDCIADEGSYMRVAGPCAIVVYETYVRIAAVYLMNLPDRSKAKELLYLVRDDLDYLAAFLSKMKPDDRFFDPGELAAMDKARIGLKVTTDTMLSGLEQPKNRT